MSNLTAEKNHGGLQKRGEAQPGYECHSSRKIDQDSFSKARGIGSKNCLILETTQIKRSQITTCSRTHYVLLAELREKPGTSS